MATSIYSNSTTYPPYGNNYGTYNYGNSGYNYGQSPQDFGGYFQYQGGNMPNNGYYGSPQNGWGNSYAYSGYYPPTQGTSYPGISTSSYNPASAYYDQTISGPMQDAQAIYKQAAGHEYSGSGSTPTTGTGKSMSDLDAMKTIQTNKRLLDNITGGSTDEVISDKDMQKALDDPNTPSDLKTAISTLKDNPLFWRAISPDGDKKFSYGELDKTITKLQEAPEPNFARTIKTDQDAMEVIQRDQLQLDTMGKGGFPDGKLSRKDLEAALDNKDVSSDTKEGIRRIINNSKFWETVDPNGDNKFTYDELKKGIDAVKNTSSHNFGDTAKEGDNPPTGQH